MKLQTLDEYKARHSKNATSQERWEPTSVACPQCGKEMLWDSWTSLTSYPPKQYWQCSDCGHVEYV
jgi:transposase